METNKYQFVKKDDILDQEINELNAGNEYLVYKKKVPTEPQVTLQPRRVPLVSLAQVRALRRPTQ
jgi:hypothetical protein